MSTRSVFLGLCLASAISATACGRGNENATLGAGVGAATGAGAGAIVGHQVGKTGGGAVIGAAAGSVIGGVVGSVRDSAEASTKEEDIFMERQRQQAERQQQELLDLQRQKFHDDYFRSRYEDGGAEQVQPNDAFGGY